MRRIFSEFAAGASTVAIAKGLNADGIPAPRGGTWSPSTIYGHRSRGVGMLSNSLFVGRQVFNRHAFPRDPDTGNRRARKKDQSEWSEISVPALAIVDEELWQRVQDRLAEIPRRPPEQHRRPKRLFSGLISCGECGERITIAYRYGCAGARQKGTCTNNRTMAASEIERRVLEGPRERLLKPELIEIFIEEYHAELQHRQKDTARQYRVVSRERTDLERQIARLVDAIAAGSAANIAAVGEKLRSLEGMLSDLPVLTDIEPENIEWHPNAVDIYKRQVADLQAALNADEITRQESTAALRGLVDRIVAYPAEKRGQFDLELHGYLAAVLNMGKFGNVGGGRGIQTLPSIPTIKIMI